MMNLRNLFLQHQAQTSNNPLALEIVKAEGNYLEDINGRRYLDIIGGISVCNVGHRHPKVLAAISKQLDAYLHVMVYGETIQSPAVQYAHWLVNHLPETLNSVYFTNSGTEATEGAMKLAKRVTGKTNFVSCINSYHGHSQGALSIMGSENWKNNFRPLLPGCTSIPYNDDAIIEFIDEHTAGVIVEPIQAESGIIKASKDWLQKIRKKCTQSGCMLIFDEIQSGFGRTGTLWAFEQYGVVPDILLLGKALGGGMPMGAFIADKKLMDQLSFNPVLGHLTTFGGHPVCCAAGLAAALLLFEERMMETIPEKEKLFIDLLKHPHIRNVRSAGLWLAVELENFVVTEILISNCIHNGLFTDWFLFGSNFLRIAPPLTITKEEIRTACNIILLSLDKIS
jgi:acetylornithine/succinyldiaminopimelate/putrescine aminotransferase